jgi:hypothetical protein
MSRFESRNDPVHRPARAAAIRLAPLAVAIPVALFFGCGGGGGGGSGGGRAAGASPPAPTAPVSSPAAGSADRVMLADFESGEINPEFNFFVNNQYNPTGRFTYEVDRTQGAAGTHASLHLHVTSGTFYFYFDPQAHGGQVRYLAGGKPVNRLGFWIKLPAGWGAGRGFTNLHIGWYLSNDRYSNETNNGHFYTQTFVVPTGDWMHVVVGENYTWQRDNTTPTFDPGRTLHRLAFDSFFGRLTRFYLTGAPNASGVPAAPDAPADRSWYPGDYDVWVDEIELFHEDDPLTVSTAVVRAAAGTTQTVDLTNHAGGAATYAIKVSDLDGHGVSVTDESGAPVTSIAIGPGRTRQVHLSPKGSGTSNVVFYQTAQDAHVQNRTVNAGYRGSFETPGAAVLVIGG